MSRQLQKNSDTFVPGHNPRGLKISSEGDRFDHFGGGAIYEINPENLNDPWSFWGPEIPGTNFHLPFWGWPGTRRKSSPLNCLDEGEIVLSDPTFNTLGCGHKLRKLL